MKITFIYVSLLLISCSKGETTVTPIAPKNLTGKVISTSQINLSWMDNSQDETGFKIERMRETGIYNVIGTVSANVTSFNDVGLELNTIYTYRICSFNSSGNSVFYSNLFVGNIISDIEGNGYNTIKINNQIWIGKNLNVSYYRNGDQIPQVSTPADWATLKTGAWCYYDNDPANESIYGKLYNWYAVNDKRGLAPTGWHIPSKTEWSSLTRYLNNLKNDSGEKLKEVGFLHWKDPNLNISVTNETGFTALPGGVRNTKGEYLIKNLSGIWWTSTPISPISSWTISMNYLNNLVDSSSSSSNENGLSVRCVKD